MSAPTQLLAAARPFKVHSIPGIISTIFLVEYPHKLLLLDAGCASDVPRVHDFIVHRLQRPFTDLKLVVATHAHPDHQVMCVLCWVVTCCVPLWCTCVLWAVCVAVGGGAGDSTGVGVGVHVRGWSLGKLVIARRRGAPALTDKNTRSALFAAPP